MQKKVFFRNRHLVITNYKYGYLLYNQFDRIIGKAVGLYGEWCDDELKLLQRFIKKGDVVLDVGANIGTHTLFFAKKVGEKGRVYAFEPQRIIFQNLCANISLNWLTNVDCKQVAVGKSSGRITVPQLNYLQSKNFGGLRLGAHKEGEQVPMIALDELNLRRCNLIKIDVELMEAQVLQGAAKTIAKHKPVIFVENNTENYSKEILAQVKKLGYVAYWHIRPYYHRKNYYGNKNPFFKRYGNEANIICVHKSKHIRSKLPKVQGIHDNCFKAMVRLRIPLVPK